MSAIPLVPLVDCTRFEIRAPLGLGSQTGVFRAFDRRLGIEVALKTVSQASQRSLYNLKREFRAAASLDHPNLVKLYELFQHGESCYFSMELVEGAELLAWPGRFDDGAQLRIARQLAEALHALHGANQLHRDVKPANLLVSADERLVLLDFGFSIPILDSLAADREPPAGTFAYMAPEILRGEPATPASDWYSVGVVLHELLTGRVPAATLETFTARLGCRRPDRAALAARPGPLADLVHDLLVERPARRPTGAEVLRRLGVSSAPRFAAAASECVGRAAELETLQKSLERSRRQACIVQVVGASGIGKTRLVSAFLERGARELDRPVLRSRCRPQEDVPYNALDGIVDELARRLADRSERAALDPQEAAALLQLFPVLAPVLPAACAAECGAPADPQEVTRSALRGLASLLAQLAGERGAILWIDDLHWADADSLRLLRLGLSELRALPLLVVLTARAEILETSPGAPAETLDLRALGEPAASELARRMLGPRGSALRWVVEQAGGSPFLIVQLADYAAARRRGEELPSADAAIVQRLAGSSPASRRIVELLAVAGRPMAVEDVLAAADLDGSALREIFRLHERRLVRGAHGPSGIEVEIYHDRIREALLPTLSDDARRRAHLRVAQVLAERPGVDARLLAEHYRAGGDAASAARLARAAARDAQAALAFARAADLIEMVLALEPESADAHALRRQRAQAFADSGRGDLAAREFAAAAALAERRGDDALDDLRLAAEQWLRIGRVRDGVAALDAVLRRLGLSYPRSPLRARAMLLGHRVLAALPARRGSPEPRAQRRFDAAFAAGLGLSPVDLLRSAAFMKQSLQLARRGCDEPRRLRALAAEGVSLAAAGGRRGRERSRALLAALGPQVERAGDPGLAALYRLCLGASQVFSGRFRDALPQLGTAHAALRRIHEGVVWESASSTLYRNWAWAQLGDLESLAGTRAAFEGACGSQDAVALAAAATSHASLAWLACDAPSEARRVSAEALARFDVEGFQSCHFADLVSQTLVDLYRGEGRAAEQRVARAWRELGRVPLLGVQIQRIDLVFLRARAALASAVERNAPVELAGAVRRLGQEDLALGPALARVLDAEALRLSGSGSAADAALRGASLACREAELVLLADVIDAVAGERPAALAQRGIARPAAFARLFLPVTAAALGW